MRLLYVDVDSLRPDHLGCYGYHRNTSPNIDSLAASGARFDEVYVSDAPCLPSRTALFSGRFGFRTGVVNHGGTAAQPFVLSDRWVADEFHGTSWMAALRSAGFHTASVSSFAERHAAWHVYAGFNEVYNSGKEGMDIADDVTPLALDWLQRNGSRDHWFLHVNYWDPHIPYRTPMGYGNPFEDDPLPVWMTEDVWRRGWEGYAPHSPQEPHGYGGETFFLGYPRFPVSIDSMEVAKQWYDGYDTGIRYMDEHVGRLIQKLSDLGIDDETAIIVSADHGESQGEFCVWGDHQTADESTCHVPLVVRWPGFLEGGRTDHALRYQLDFAATTIEAAGGSVPSNWDGRSFFKGLAGGADAGREFVALSQGAHVCQRGVRFNEDGDRYLFLRTYHDGYKMLEPVMLFNLSRDPHEERDMSGERPDVVARAEGHLASWLTAAMRRSKTNVDPMMTSMREGPLHARGNALRYAERLRATGRSHHARRLLERHPEEVQTYVRG